MNKNQTMTLARELHQVITTVATPRETEWGSYSFEYIDFIEAMTHNAAFIAADGDFLSNIEKLLNFLSTGVFSYFMKITETTFVVRPAFYSANWIKNYVSDPAPVVTIAIPPSAGT